MPGFLLELYENSEREDISLKEYAKSGVEEAEKLVRKHRGNISQKKF